MIPGIGYSTNSTPAPIVRAFLVYDKVTGEILHVHRSITFSRAEHGEKPEERALRVAGHTSTGKAGVIEVDPKDINHAKPVRVDVASQKLTSGAG